MRYKSYSFPILRRNSRDITSRMTPRQEAAKIPFDAMRYDSEIKPVVVSHNQVRC